jgi:hypothetical protein
VLVPLRASWFSEAPGPWRSGSPEFPTRAVVLVTDAGLSILDRDNGLEMWMMFMRGDLLAYTNNFLAGQRTPAGFTPREVTYQNGIISITQYPDPGSTFTGVYTLHLDFLHDNIYADCSINEGGDVIVPPTPITTVTIISPTVDYPVGAPVTYVAAPVTQGYQPADHIVEWMFDDGSSTSGISVTKTWATSGPHTAFAKATNATTGGVGEASKTISLSSVSTSLNTRPWVSTGSKMFASVASTANTGFPVEFELLVAGDFLVNLYDVNHPQTIITYNTVTGERREYGDQLTTIGTPAGAWALHSGPNAGKILIVGCQGGHYGIFDPHTGIVTMSQTLISSSGGSQGYDFQKGYKFPNTLMLDGRVFFAGGLSLTFRGKIYDPVADTWENDNGVGIGGIIASVFTMPSGSLFAITLGPNPQSYIKDSMTGLWSPGPTPPVSMTDNHSYCQMPDGTIFTTTLGTTAVASVMREGGVFSFMAAPYPYLEQDSTTADGVVAEYVITAPDGIVVNLGGYGVNHYAMKNYENPKVAYYTPAQGDAWVVGAPFNVLNRTHRGCFCNGKLWRVGATGILEYLVWA